MTADLETRELLVNMGPQHPSTHGVLRLVVRTDGELVAEATPVLGYLHRCAEKIGGSVPYPAFVPYTDRMDYIAAMGDNLAFCLAVEKLMALEIPPRAQYLRVIACELNRIASHLLATGVYGMDIGAFTPFLYTMREREYVLNLFEYLCGARLTLNYIKIGGVHRDADRRFVEETRRFLDILEDRIRDYHDLLTHNRIFITRTRGVGVISAADAVAWGVSGPNLRASGVAYDVRKARPYSGYEKFEFDVPLGRDDPGVVGDCWNRYWVRIEEMRQSARIVRQALDGLPAGKFDAQPKKVKPPPGEAYTAVENPRGELGFYVVSDGAEVPLRVRARAPSFCNLSILSHMARGVLIADLIAILGSIDIVLGEIDR